MTLEEPSVNASEIEEFFYKELKKVVFKKNFDELVKRIQDEAGSWKEYLLDLAKEKEQYMIDDQKS
jgi:hypothetical protein